jgi:regulator of sigma E protease
MNGVTHAPYLDTNLVGLVSEESSAWGKIEQGDRIISINGKDVSNWTDINAKFNDMSIDYSLILLRGDDTVSTSVHIPLPDPKLLEAKSSGIFPPIPAVIGRVDENSAAYNAGFLAGDSIISINEEEVLSWFAVSETIAGYNDSLGEIFIKVARGGEIMDLSVRPNFNREHRRYMIGIVMANPSTEIKRHGLASALSLAYRECIRYSVLIFETLQKLVTRKISPDYLSGPVGIMQMSGAAVQSGLSSLLQLLALIGINLGLLNLMPLVITDGGVLSLLLIEAVRRKPIPIVLREKLSYIVMVAFLCLAVFVTFNDIMRFETIEKLLNFR